MFQFSFLFLLLKLVLPSSRSLPDDAEMAYRIMAGIVLASGVTCVLITIKGHKGLLFGKEADHTKLRIPVAQEEEKVEEKEEVEKKEVDQAPDAEEEVSGV